MSPPLVIAARACVGNKLECFNFSARASRCSVVEIRVMAVNRRCAQCHAPACCNGASAPSRPHVKIPLIKLIFNKNF